jgi:hypothetical protein
MRKKQTGRLPSTAPISWLCIAYVLLPSSVKVGKLRPATTVANYYITDSCGCQFPPATKYSYFCVNHNISFNTSNRLLYVLQLQTRANIVFQQPFYRV